MSQMLKKTCSLVVILMLLPISGCFDYEVFLTLNQKGNGSLAIELRVPARWGGEDQLHRLNSIVQPKPTRKASMTRGRVVLRESAKFQFLDEVSAHRVLFKITTLDKGIAGLTDFTYRISVTLKPVDGDLPDRLVLPGREEETHKLGERKKLDAAQLRAQTLMARTLKGHFIIMHLKLPGSVSGTKPVVAGSKIVQAKLNKKTGEVFWRVPVSALAADKVRHNLTFVADFSGDLKFRAERHESIESRHP